MGTAQKESIRNQQAFWEMVLETWRGSGLSVRQFCQQEGLAKGSFYRWRRKLGGVDESGGNAPANSRCLTAMKSPTVESGCHGDVASWSAGFIEVSPTGPSSPLELVLRSGHRLKIAAGADTALLHRVLMALQQVGLC